MACTAQPDCAGCWSCLTWNTHWRRMCIRRCGGWSRAAERSRAARGLASVASSRRATSTVTSSRPCSPKFCAPGSTVMRQGRGAAAGAVSAARLRQLKVLCRLCTLGTAADACSCDRARAGQGQRAGALAAAGAHQQEAQLGAALGLVRQAARLHSDHAHGRRVVALRARAHLQLQGLCIQPQPAVCRAGQRSRRRHAHAWCPGVRPRAAPSPETPGPCGHMHKVAPAGARGRQHPSVRAGAPLLARRLPSTAQAAVEAVHPARQAPSVCTRVWLRLGGTWCGTG